MRTPALVLVAFLFLASPALAAPPVPGYTVTPDPPVAGSEATFHDASTDADGHPITLIQWDFENDGTWDATLNPASDPSATHTYPSAGTWSLRMRVTAGGESAEIVDLITVATPNVTPIPQFAFSPLGPVEGEPITFDSSFSYDEDGSIASQAWDLDGDGFDDGTGVALTTSSLPVGTHTVALKVTDNAGATAVVSRTVTVASAPGNAAPVPQFAFSPLSPRVGDAITFDSSFSYDEDGSIASQAWDLDGDGFDDGTGVTLTTSSLGVGTHTVRLEVTDDDGGTAIVSRTVTVAPPGNSAPTARFAFSPLSPVAGEAVLFDSQFSSDFDGSITSQAWDVDGDGFDDGSGATLTWSFAEGTHTVRLQVTDDDGAVSAPAARTVIVGPAPTVTQPGASTSTAPPTTTTPTTTTTTTTPPPAGPSLMSPFPIVRIAGTVLRRGARVRTLEVRTSIGSRITVRCVGRSCPFARVSRVAKRRLVRFRGMRGFLRAGVAVSISVRKTGQIGKYTRFVIRANRVPKRTDLCLMPGRSSPSECPES